MMEINSLIILLQPINLRIGKDRRNGRYRYNAGKPKCYDRNFYERQFIRNISTYLSKKRSCNMIAATPRLIVILWVCLIDYTLKFSAFS